MSTRAPALLLLAIGAAVAALALPGRADAHAVLLRSYPADGARLSSSPEQIRLWFNEDVSRRLSTVQLTGAHVGRVVGVQLSQESGKTIEISLPRLRTDAYLLRWHTVSDDDLHSTGGSLVFGVGRGVGPALSALKAEGLEGPSGPDLPETAFRWIDFAAIAGLLGALALLAVCFPRADKRGATELGEARRRLGAVATASALTALLTGVGLILLKTRELTNESTTSALTQVLLQTSYGRSWIVRELLLCTLFLLIPLVARRRPGIRATALTVALSISLCLSIALNSHAASARGGVSVATAALALHLLSACLWSGGVCALTVVLIGNWKKGRADRGSMRLLLRSFGGLAAISVAVLALTGVYSAGVSVASPDELVTTLYGRTLLVKTALFLVVGAVGLANSLLVRFERDGSRWLGRGIRVELSLAAVVILLAALLTASPPAVATKTIAIVPPAPVPAPIKSARVGDLLVSLSVKPNQPGTNFFTVGVFDTRRPALAPIRRVEVSVGRDDWQRAAKVRDQYWQLASSRLGRPGNWLFGVRVSRAGLPAEAARISWSLGPSRPQQAAVRAVASGRSLAPILSATAAAGALALMVALLGLALREMPVRSPAGWLRARVQWSTHRQGRSRGPQRARPSPTER